MHRDKNVAKQLMENTDFDYTRMILFSQHRMMCRDKHAVTSIHKPNGFLQVSLFHVKHFLLLFYCEATSSKGMTQKLKE